MKKKKVIVVIIFLFLIGGLTVFTFANPISQKKAFKSKNQQTESLNFNDKNEHNALNKDESSSEKIEKKEDSLDLSNESSQTVKNQSDDNIPDDNIIVAVDSVDIMEQKKLENDTTAPQFKGLKNGYYYDEKELNIDVDDANLDSITVYSYKTGETKTVENNSKLTEESIYKLTATDKAGNKTEIYVAIDRTAPVFKNVKNGHSYKENKTLEIEDLRLKQVDVYNYATKETKKYTFEELFNGTKVELNSDATYSVTAYDFAGHSTKVYVTIDTIVPEIKINGSTEIKDIYNQVNLYVTDANKFTGTITNKTTGSKNPLNANKEKDEKGNYVASTGISSMGDGEYEVTIKDAAGNESTVTFTYDTTAPKITLKKYTKDNKGAEVETNGYYTYSLVAYVEDENIDTIKLDGEDYVSGDEIGSRKTHKLVATDKAGNSTTIEFTIDKDYPLIYLNGKKNEKVKTEVQYFNKDVEVKVKENNLDKVVVTKDGEEVAFEEGMKLTDEGTYKIVATDKANLKTEVNFVIDKTAPKVWVDDKENSANVVDGVAYTASGNANTNVHDTNPFEFSIVDENGKTIATLPYKYAPGEWYGNKDYAFRSGISHLIKQNKQYTIKATDKAGNTTEYPFVWDKTAPESKKLTTKTIKKNNKAGVKVTDNNVTTWYATNGDSVEVHVAFNEELSEEPNLIINNQDFGKMTYIEKNKEYKKTIKVTENNDWKDGLLDIRISNYKDLAGNVGKELTMSENGTMKDSYGRVAIDRTAPEIKLDKLTDGYTNDKDLTIRDANKFTSEIKKDGKVVKSDIESDKLANGTYYDRYGVWSKDGEYTITVKDVVGNESTVKFVYDSTPASINVSDLKDGITKNSRFSVSDTNLVKIELYKDGVLKKVFTDLSTIRNSSVTAATKGAKVAGEYTIIAYDKAGNKSEITYRYVSEDNSIVEIDANGEEAKDLNALLNSEEIKDGDVLVLGEGNYKIGENDKTEVTDKGSLYINKDVIIQGKGEGKTVIEVTNDKWGQGGVYVEANNVTIENVTIKATSNVDYAIKVSANTPLDQVLKQLDSVSLKNVTVETEGKSGINIHGVNKVVLDGVTVKGNDSNLKMPIQVASSPNVTITNTTVDHGTWGDLGIMYKDNNQYLVKSHVTIGTGNNLETVYTENLEKGDFTFNDSSEGYTWNNLSETVWKKSKANNDDTEENAALEMLEQLSKLVEASAYISTSNGMLNDEYYSTNTKVEALNSLSDKKHYIIWFAEFKCDPSKCEGFDGHFSKGKVSSVIEGRRGDIDSIEMEAPQAKEGYHFVGWMKYETEYSNIQFYGYEAIYEAN